MGGIGCFDKANEIGVEIGRQVHSDFLFDGRSEQLPKDAYDHFHREVVLGGNRHGQQKAFNVHHLIDHVVDHWLGQAGKDGVSPVA